MLFSSKGKCLETTAYLFFSGLHFLFLTHFFRRDRIRIMCWCSFLASCYFLDYFLTINIKKLLRQYLQLRCFLLLPRLPFLEKQHGITKTILGLSYLTKVFRTTKVFLMLIHPEIMQSQRFLNHILEKMIKYLFGETMPKYRCSRKNGRRDAILLPIIYYLRLNQSRRQKKLSTKPGRNILSLLLQNYPFHSA